MAISNGKTASSLYYNGSLTIYTIKKQNVNIAKIPELTYTVLASH